MTENQFNEWIPNNIDINDKVNVYAGIGDLPILSNLGTCTFTWRNREWNSVEQAYMFMKACYFKSGQHTKNRILKSKDGFEAKRIGKDIKDKHILPHWLSIRYSVMKHIIRASLSNNTKLRVLLRTGNSLITHNPETSEWKYLFPKILMELREEFKK